MSFGISQPQYHGAPAEYRDIERCFSEAGWTRLKDPSGHVIFFNYAFGVMAIDAERRNCYLTDGQLQPFDVILCRPDAAMQAFSPSPRTPNGKIAALTAIPRFLSSPP